MTPDNTTPRPMTLQQARDILAARFPNQRVCVSEHAERRFRMARDGSAESWYTCTRFTARTEYGGDTIPYASLDDLLADAHLKARTIEYPVVVSEEDPANG